MVGLQIIFCLVLPFDPGYLTWHDFVAENRIDNNNDHYPFFEKLLQYDDLNRKLGGLIIYNTKSASLILHKEAQ
jgi:hypothetical protein